MRLGILFSGGKDSCLALARVLEEGHEVVCLITIQSQNKESYMFHTPNVNLAAKQAEAIGIPIFEGDSKGEKEKELKELKEIILKAKKKYNLDGIVTGAIASNYQASRIKKICNDLDLKCVNPLWGMEQEKLLREIVERKFEVIIVSVSAEGLGKEWLGKRIDEFSLENLKALSEKYKFNLAFEGGEAETFVINSPIFKRKIKIVNAQIIWEGNSGRYEIKEIILVNK